MLLQSFSPCEKKCNNFAQGSLSHAIVENEDLRYLQTGEPLLYVYFFRLLRNHHFPLKGYYP